MFHLCSNTDETLLLSLTTAVSAATLPRQHLWAHAAVLWRLLLPTATTSTSRAAAFHTTTVPEAGRCQRLCQLLYLCCTFLVNPVALSITIIVSINVRQQAGKVIVTWVSQLLNCTQPREGQVSALGVVTTLLSSKASTGSHGSRGQTQPDSCSGRLQGGPDSRATSGRGAELQGPSNCLQVASTGG